MQERIPKHARKVFTGVRTEVYQWDQELYDGSTTVFERVRFLDGAFVIAMLPDGSILMTEQEQPARESSFFSLPGGAFDSPDEDPLDCAQRELFEETGYESDEWEHWTTSEGTSNVVVSTYFYIARNCRPRGDHVNPDHGEKIRLFTVNFDEFLLFCEESGFVHWTLLPHLFGARLHEEKYRSLRDTFYKNIL